MDYGFLNRKEYEGISILQMQDNDNTPVSSASNRFIRLHVSRP